MLYGGGLRIYTTLDPTCRPRRVRRRHRHASTSRAIPTGALVAVDDDGHVQGDGGRPRLRADESQGEPRRRAAGGGIGRQPGSSFKPFVLAEAVREGISLDPSSRRRRRSTFPGPDNAGATGTSATTAAASRACRPRRRHREVVEHRVRPAHDRGRRGEGADHGQPARASRDPEPRLHVRWCSAPARCRRSTWPPPTRPSPTGACTSTRRRSLRVDAGRRHRPGRLSGARPRDRCSTEDAGRPS